MINKDDNDQELKLPEKKKISLEDAIKHKLANKKKDQLMKKHSNHSVKNLKNMKSQQTKKANNQHRRTGV